MTSKWFHLGKFYIHYVKDKDSFPWIFTQLSFSFKKNKIMIEKSDVLALTFENDKTRKIWGTRIKK